VRDLTTAHRILTTARPAGMLATVRVTRAGRVHVVIVHAAEDRERARGVVICLDPEATLG
jgi:hypothetical protein